MRLPKAAPIAGMMFVLLASGCSVLAQPGPPVPLKSIVLTDVQGLFGGQDIWASQDRTAVVRLAGHSEGHVGLWERRYKVTLTSAQWSELERLVGAHNLLTAKMAQRNGVADEAHPDVALVTRNGMRVEIGKWANDKHPAFDPVYAYLLELSGAAPKSGELLSEGPYDWKWKPDGFDRARFGIQPTP